MPTLRRLLALACVVSVVSAVSPAVAQDASPCTYLPEAVVRAALPVSADQPLKNSDGAVCRWEWPVEAGPGAARSVRGVSLNFLRSARITSKTIETLFVRLRDGTTQEVRGQQVTIAPKAVEWIDGVGDKAFWNDELSQLAVSAGGRLFYLSVSLDGMTKAEKIAAASDAARAVVGRL